MSSRLDSLKDKIRRNEPIPSVVAALLSAGTPLFRIGMLARAMQGETRVGARVISYGNITAGGTGKTPAVIERARAELAAGGRVAVLTRGYRSEGGKACVIVDSRTPRQGLHTIIGDEPALILRRAPGVVVVRDADRVRGAVAAMEQCGCDTLILDDGFQYLRLARDENHVLVDASNPFGSEWLIPRGILREPLAALCRATAITLTRCDQARDLAGLVARLGALAPQAPIRLTRHVARDPWRLIDGQRMPLGELRGARVRAVCGIGHPEAFARTLESLGAVVAECASYPDHEGIPAAAFASSLVTITTEKDAMRLGDPAQHIYALPVELETYQP